MKYIKSFENHSSFDEKIICPECGGSGFGEGIGMDQNDELYHNDNKCPVCKGYSEVWKHNNMPAIAAYKHDPTQNTSHLFDGV